MVERQRFAASMGASALLHMFVLGSIFLLAVAPKPELAIPTVDIDLASLPPVAPRPAVPVGPAAPSAPAAPAPPQVAMPQRQIVEPPDAGEEREPENARLLSDRNNVVPQEMVRRGDGGLDPNSTEQMYVREPKPAAPPEPAPPPPQPQARPRAEAPLAKARPEPKPPAPKPAPKEVAKPRPRPPASDRGDFEDSRLAKLPSLDSLIPRAEDLARSQPLPPSGPQRERSGRDLLNSGGQVFSGRPGTRDFLPRVAEGNITMLNTKADLFAPFVRRVAGRVFENLDLALRSFRSARGTGNGRTVALVEAVMDRQGRFVRVELREQQGLNSVSRLLLDSAQPDTFFDANPPSGAEANDGLIHFQLMIDLTVNNAVDPRTGRNYNSYYGIAGVGLM